MAEPLNETSALCRDCGLCCNGSIYSVAPVRDDEADFARSAGFDVKPQPNGTLAFDLPCSHLCGTACSIYDKRRLHICGDYFCTLALRLEAGETGMPAARKAVEVAQDLIRQIAELVPEGESIRETNNRWLKMVEGHEPTDARLSLLVTALQRHLDRHFRYDPQKVVGRDEGPGQSEMASET